MDGPLSDAMLLRIAARIREQLVMRQADKCAELERQVSLMLEEADRLRPVLRRLAVCRSRGWMASVSRLAATVEQASRELLYLRGDLDRAASATSMEPPSLRDVYLDLKQAQEEFDTLRYDPKEKVLGIVTEPIELEGVYLGEFEIRLEIDAIAESRVVPYRVMALDPHPAAANESVTHPHVSDERLCAGDAYAAIRAALDGGRIFDFFSLVRGVLTTYNPSSPYVSLEDWNGAACWECGGTMGSDESRWCDLCEHEYCEDCASYCSRCNETTCLNCLSTCPVCDDSVCGRCLVDCPECGRSLCKNCLDDEQCPCHEEEDDEPDEGSSDAGRGAEAGARRLSA